jgi:predicted PurR-regulated permease PerM
VSEQDQVDEQEQGPAGYRLGRLWRAADLRKVPLRTIVAAILAVAFFYLAGTLIYRLRDVVLLMLVAGFLALILNPLVVVLQKYVVRSRGVAVTMVTLLALVAFAGLAYVFGSPLVNGITSFANKLPSYVSSAETGRGWIGHLVQRYHVQRWVTQNSPKLVSWAQDLSKPALAFGKGALSLVIELVTIFILVLMLLLEGPKLRRGVLAMFSPRQRAEIEKVASEVNRGVVGYMLGNFLTSVICGLVVYTTLAVTGVPFPQLWALWVALVDFLPMIGGALAGIPTVLFAFASTAPALTPGIVTLIAFLVYTQVENHILNPIIMSRTVRISPLLVLVSVLVGASIGSLVGGLFGGFVAALLAIPIAGAFQVIVREAWRLSGPPPKPRKPVELEPAKGQAQLEAATGEAPSDGQAPSHGQAPPEGQPPSDPRPGGATTVTVVATVTELTEVTAAAAPTAAVALPAGRDGTQSAAAESETSAITR